MPFGDVKATAKAITDLLSDDEARLKMSEVAYAAGRAMIWPNIAQTYLDVMRRSIQQSKLMPLSSRSVPRLDRLPAIQTHHFKALCDSTGITQHALFDIPDRAHGYCVDDNARALILACQLARTPQALDHQQTLQFCAFIQHAWNPDNQRFRNFMSYERRWLEDQGSEDSHGRTLWALGICARDATSQSVRLWARGLMTEALALTMRFTSPRAIAFVFTWP